MDPALNTYRSASTSGGWMDRSDRVRLEVTGPDRAKFLQNLTTNEVKRLAVGRGCETFVTSPQGKTLGYVSLLALEDRILLRTDPGGLAGVLPHFQKYGIFDEVAWEDVTKHTLEVHLLGPLSGDLLSRLGGEVLPETDLAHRGMTVAARPVRVIRECPSGRPGLTLIGGRADAPAVFDALRGEAGGLGMVAIDPGTFEALRIEAGTPAFGRDVTAENLPQEVGRDPQAISFVKGCYLGQETVARLDALGHVNKILKGLRLDTPTPPPAGTPLEADGKRVGTITSSGFSPGWGQSVALGYVRVAHARPGTELVALVGEDRVIATVCDLPMIPPALP